MTASASHKDNTILKFADDTTVIGLISGGDETAYRREVASLVKCFKLLGVHICDDLTWTLNITQLVKKAHQRLYFLMRLRKSGMSQRTQRTSYTGRHRRAS
ncbi:hypothetical protein L3Q82_002245 [Scortum barcoo]|uniref:Uncharacterized protein n=1 Tax=Scortum barcoo TaxID=214431 RepID=A0ACB8VY20_9TELE|nr:hypothetical protein L3Q82_002245 [Scortum barcoo]